jgi:carboxyl-terminal processing protease
MLRILSVVLITAVLTNAIPAAAQDKSSETYRYLNLFGDVFERVRAEYVEEVSDQKLIEAAINGMLSSLDPHSSYLNQKSFEDMQVQTKGEFGGLGIEVTLENGLVKVVSPIDETPAHRAGLQPGDLISHIDGEPVIGLSLSDAVEKMRGKPDTDITLTIRRGDEQPFDVTLTRAVIRIKSVRSRLEGAVGYIRVTSFNQQTTENLTDAYDSLQKEAPNGGLTGLILDLRNNPGGLLNEAVSVSDAFLDKGEIVSTRGRKKDDAQRFNASPGDVTNGLPIVVLINGGSASASEIVAGALQDHRRAILLGTPTFGKGSVQTIQPIPSHGAIRLTTARYYTPSGTSIQAKGIVPDIAVQPARIENIDVSARRREADLRGALQQEQPASESTNQPPVSDADEKAVEPDESVAPGMTPSQADYQLQRAIDLVRGIALYSQRSH